MLFHGRIDGGVMKFLGVLSHHMVDHGWSEIRDDLVQGLHLDQEPHQILPRVILGRRFSIRSESFRRLCTRINTCPLWMRIS